MFLQRIRLIFLIGISVMALSSLVVFTSNFIPWVQFRFFSQPALLFALTEAPGNNTKEDLIFCADCHIFKSST